VRFGDVNVLARGPRQVRSASSYEEHFVRRARAGTLQTGPSGNLKGLAIIRSTLSSDSMAEVLSRGNAKAHS
jgi:hypothetical protein